MKKTAFLVVLFSFAYSSSFAMGSKRPEVPAEPKQPLPCTDFSGTYDVSRVVMNGMEIPVGSSQVEGDSMTIEQNDCNNLVMITYKNRSQRKRQEILLDGVCRYQNGSKNAFETYHLEGKTVLGKFEANGCGGIPFGELKLGLTEEGRLDSEVVIFSTDLFGNREEMMHVLVEAKKGK